MLRRLETIGVFVQKLKSVTEDIANKITLRKKLEAILEFLRQKDYSKEEVIQYLLDDHENLKLGVELIDNAYEEKVKKEELLAMNQSPIKLQDHEVRFIEIKPTKVAYYHTTINQPEDEAWNVLYAWVKKRGLDHKSTSRYFGFDKPGENQEHGYEMWATVTDEIEPLGEV